MTMASIHIHFPLLFLPSIERKKGSHKFCLLAAMDGRWFLLKKNFLNQILKLTMHKFTVQLFDPSNSVSHYYCNDCDVIGPTTLKCVRLCYIFRVLD